MAERYGAGISTLTAPLSSTATSMTLADASTFPASGNFHCLIDSEIVLGTSVSGLDVQILRGIEGSVQRSHITGSVVTQILAASSFSQIRKDQFGHGPAANRPAVADCRAGDVYFPTDAPGFFWFNGSAWKVSAGLFPAKPLDISRFSWVNQGTASYTTKGSVVSLRAAAAAGDNLRILCKPVPGYTPWTVRMLAMPSGLNVNPLACGMVVREGVSGKLYTLQYSLGYQAQMYRMNSVTSGYYGVGSSQNIYTGPTPLWMQMRYDGTLISSALSLDGISWLPLGSEAAGNHFGSAPPSQVGFFCNSGNNSWPSDLTVFGWEEIDA